MAMTASPIARVVLGLWILVAAIAGAPACIKTQAKTVPDGPPLDVPPPPARVIAPTEEPIATAPAEPLEPAPAPSSTTRRPTRRQSNAGVEQNAPKPDPPPVEAPLPQAAQPEAPAPNAAPAPTLRAPGSAEKPIRDRVSNAQRDLSKVDYAKLTEEGKSQYDQSKRFIQQAEQALKEQNFVFAQTLADKAAQIAAELLGR